MDEAAYGGGCDDTQQPQDDQYCSDCPKHLYVSFQYSFCRAPVSLLKLNLNCAFHWSPSNVFRQCLWLTSPGYVTHFCITIMSHFYDTLGCLICQLFSRNVYLLKASGPLRKPALIQQTQHRWACFAVLLQPVFLLEGHNGVFCPRAIHTIDLPGIKPLVLEPLLKRND